MRLTLPILLLLSQMEDWVKTWPLALDGGVLYHYEQQSCQCSDQDYLPCCQQPLLYLQYNFISLSPVRSPLAPLAHVLSETDQTQED